MRRACDCAYQAVVTRPFLYLLYYLGCVPVRSSGNRTPPFSQCSAIMAACLVTQAHLCCRGLGLHTYATAAAQSSFLDPLISSYIANKIIHRDAERLAPAPGNDRLASIGCARPIQSCKQTLGMYNLRRRANSALIQPRMTAKGLNTFTKLHMASPPFSISIQKIFILQNVKNIIAYYPIAIVQYIVYTATAQAGESAGLWDEGTYGHPGGTADSKRARRSTAQSAVLTRPSRPKP